MLLVIIVHDLMYMSFPLFCITSYLYRCLHVMYQFLLLYGSLLSGLMVDMVSRLQSIIVVDIRS